MWNFGNVRAHRAKFNELKSNDIPVTGKMFKSIAKNIKNEFQASKGGLTRLKLRNRQRFKKLFGGKNSSNFDGAQEYLNNFKEITTRKNFSLLRE